MKFLMQKLCIFEFLYQKVLVLKFHSSKNIRLSWFSVDQQQPVVSRCNNKVFQDVWELLASQVFVPALLWASYYLLQLRDPRRLRLQWCQAEVWASDKWWLGLHVLVSLRIEAIELKDKKQLRTKNISRMGKSITTEMLGCFHLEW